MIGHKWMRTSIFTPSRELCAPLSVDYCNVPCLRTSAIPSRDLFAGRARWLVVQKEARCTQKSTGWKAALRCQYGCWIRLGGKEAPLITIRHTIRKLQTDRRLHSSSSSNINCFICIRPLVGGARKNAVLISVISITKAKSLEKLDLLVLLCMFFSACSRHGAESVFTFAPRRQKF